MDNAEFVRTVAVDDIAEGAAILVQAGPNQVLLCRSDGAYFAIANECSHAFQPLECGIVRNGWIACPAHGTRFDLATGEPLNPPANAPVSTYPLQVRDGWIWVNISRIA